MSTRGCTGLEADSRAGSSRCAPGAKSNRQPTAPAASRGSGQSSSRRSEPAPVSSRAPTDIRGGIHASRRRLGGGAQRWGRIEGQRRLPGKGGAVGGHAWSPSATQGILRVTPSSSMRPGPARTTVPAMGLSLADSGRNTPPADTSATSCTCTPPPPPAAASPPPGLHQQPQEPPTPPPRLPDLFTSSTSGLFKGARQSFRGVQWLHRERTG